MLPIGNQAKKRSGTFSKVVELEGGRVGFAMEWSGS